MRKSHLIRGQHLQDILREAVDRRLPVLLTHRAETGWMNFHTRLIDYCAEPAALIIEPPQGQREYAAAHPPTGAAVGVSVRKGHNKYMFSSTLEISDVGGEVEYSLPWPDELQRFRRRVYERVEPPPGRPIAVRFWCVASQEGGEEVDRVVRFGELEDISCGGIRIVVQDSSSISAGATYRCVFTPRAGSPPVVTEAVCRHQEASAGGRTSLGFHFVGLEATDEGRHVLSRLASIVGQFQRMRTTAQV